MFAAFNKTKEFASRSLQISEDSQPSDSGNAAPLSGIILDPAASNEAPPAVAVNDESLSPAVTDKQNVEAAELSGATCSHEVVQTEVECERVVVK